jgi:hypothetical protein
MVDGIEQANLDLGRVTALDYVRMVKGWFGLYEMSQGVGPRPIPMLRYRGVGM